MTRLISIKVSHVKLFFIDVVNIVAFVKRAESSDNKLNIPYYLSDVTRPSFGNSCPADIRVDIRHNSTVIVNWTQPFAIDNSNIAPTISVVPPDAKPPYAMNETTIILYVAADNAGNIAQCSFEVIVEGECSHRRKTW